MYFEQAKVQSYLPNCRNLKSSWSDVEVPHSRPLILTQVVYTWPSRCQFSCWGKVVSKVNFDWFEGWKCEDCFRKVSSHVYREGCLLDCLSCLKSTLKLYNNLIRTIWTSTIGCLNSLNNKEIYLHLLYFSHHQRYTPNDIITDRFIGLSWYNK